MTFKYSFIFGALGALVAVCAPAAQGASRPENTITRAGVVAALEQSAGPKKGVEAAPITLVYFTDFQCGYCRKFVQDTLPKLTTEYVQKGLVQLVFRHLAILGPQSVQAGQAAACAQDQSRFWEYHDRLFAENGSPTAFAAANLKHIAEEVKIDPRTFGTCLEQNTHAQQVESETLLAQALGARGTPAFLINGQLAMGAYPFEAFQQALNGILKDKAPRQ